MSTIIRKARIDLEDAQFDCEWGGGEAAKDNIRRIKNEKFQSQRLG